MCCPAFSPLLLSLLALCVHVCRWGSTFSNKFFLEKRFVVKHIHNKHAAKLDEQRDAIRDELYWQAYEAAKKAQHAAARAAAKERDAAAVAAASAAQAATAEGHFGGEGEWQVRCLTQQLGALAGVLADAMNTCGCFCWSRGALIARWHSHTAAPCLRCVSQAHLQRCGCQPLLC